MVIGIEFKQISRICIVLVVLSMQASAELQKMNISDPADLMQSPLEWFNNQPATIQLAFYGLTGLLSAIIAIMIWLIFGKSLFQILGGGKTKDNSMTWDGLKTIGALMGVLVLFVIVLAFYYAGFF